MAKDPPYVPAALLLCLDDEWRAIVPCPRCRMPSFPLLTLDVMPAICECGKFYTVDVDLVLASGTA